MTTIAYGYSVIISHIIFTKDRMSNTTIDHSYLGIITNMYNIWVRLLAHKIRLHRSPAPLNNTSISEWNFTTNFNAITNNDFIKRRNFSSATTTYRRSDIRKVTNMHTITRCTHVIRNCFIVRAPKAANHTTNNSGICTNTNSIKIWMRFYGCAAPNTTSISARTDLNIIPNYYFIMIRFFFARKTTINTWCNIRTMRYIYTVIICGAICISTKNSTVIFLI